MTVRGYTTMTEAMQDLNRRGFSANFEFLDRTFRAVNGGKTFTPDQLTIVEHHHNLVYPYGLAETSADASV